MEDSAASVDLELSVEDLAALDAARAVAGNRYNEEGMKRVRL